MLRQSLEDAKEEVEMRKAEYVKAQMECARWE
jgi:hypothetical protein